MVGEVEVAVPGPVAAVRKDRAVGAVEEGVVVREDELAQLVLGCHAQRGAGRRADR
jgi:hypothetical protein